MQKEDEIAFDDQIRGKIAETLDHVIGTLGEVTLDGGCQCHLCRRRLALIDRIAGQIGSTADALKGPGK